MRGDGAVSTAPGFRPRTRFDGEGFASSSETLSPGCRVLLRDVRVRFGREVGTDTLSPVGCWLLLGLAVLFLVLIEVDDGPASAGPGKELSFFLLSSKCAWYSANSCIVFGTKSLGRLGGTELSSVTMYPSPSWVPQLWGNISSIKIEFSLVTACFTLTDWLSSVESASLCILLGRWNG